MGKKYRENRKKIKRNFIKFGFKEDGYGELKKKTTKAEARALLVRQKEEICIRRYMIMDSMSEKAKLEIYAQVDRETIEYLERCMTTLL